MPNIELDPKTNAKQTKLHAPEEESLKGTFISVMLLGLFLLVTWLLVFILFITRN